MGNLWHKQNFKEFYLPLFLLLFLGGGGCGGPNCLRFNRHLKGIGPPKGNIYAIQTEESETDNIQRSPNLVL